MSLSISRPITNSANSTAQTLTTTNNGNQYINGNNKTDIKSVGYEPSNETVEENFFFLSEKLKQQQQLEKLTEIIKMSDNNKQCRDRLGFWGLSSDSETSGNISGLERLRNAHFNKVSQKNNNKKI